MYNFKVIHQQGNNKRVVINQKITPTWNGNIVYFEIVSNKNNKNKEFIQIMYDSERVVIKQETNTILLCNNKIIKNNYEFSVGKFNIFTKLISFFRNDNNLEIHYQIVDSDKVDCKSIQDVKITLRKGQNNK